MTNYGADELLSNPNNEQSPLSEELVQKFDELLYATGEKLETLAKPDSMEVDIEGIQFGRLMNGTLMVGSTSTEYGYDGRIRYTDSDDPEQSFHARYAAQLTTIGWMVDGNKRWSHRQLLDKIESQWPNSDDSVAHQEAYTLSQNPEAAKTLTPQRIIELAEIYALLHDTGSKSFRAEYDYEGTIHSDGHSGSRRVESTFRLDKDDRFPDMPRCQFEMRFPSKNLTYTVQKDEMGMISMHARQVSEFSGKTSFITVQDPETVYECLSTIADNMVNDKSHDEL